MDILWIYEYGILTTYLTSVFFLAYDKTTSEDCDITKPECVFLVLPLLALTSWWGLLIILANEVHKQRKDR